MRVNILLACTECKRRNYATVKNKKNTTGRVELKKVLPLGAEPTRFTAKPGSDFINAGQ